MKILGWDPMATMKTRIACTGASSTASYMKINQRAPQECCESASFKLIKQLFWKIRAKWKQYRLRRQRGNVINYSYDAKSYKQNFDSGRPLDHPCPFAP